MYRKTGKISSIILPAAIIMVFAMVFGNPIFAGIPATNAQNIAEKQVKVRALEAFFEKYKSPLKPHAETFVDVADKYGIEYTLLPAISCMESTCGKFMIPQTYNPFGWGIYGTNYIAFKSFDEAIEVVGSVLPFKTNNYVVENLINWENVPNDPMFTLTFPRKDMLRPHQYDRMLQTIKSGASKSEIKDVANEIRLELNPHPAGQLDHNVPIMDGEKVFGMQHKYRETVLFFPGQGQTCHAYCTFCFRWPQFVGMDELRFASKQAEHLVEYVSNNESVTDVLFTGGDPLIMKTKILEAYIRPLLESNLDNLRNIRIGSKALAYWPYRFLTI